MDLGLAGLNVLVTGASGGIGSATARALAAEGARVAVHYHSNRVSAEALAAEIDGVVVAGDLTDESQVEAMFAAAIDQLGPIDVCVANSGRWEDGQPLWEMSVERFRRIVDDNLITAFLTCREFLRHVRATGRGDIVLVSSTSAIFGEFGNADYAAAKSAVAYGLALTLKNEIVHLDPQGRVNVVAPGWTLTDGVRASLDDAAIAGATATRPLKSISTPEQVAAAIVMLASRTAMGHCTGQIVEVAGGMEGRLVTGG